MLAGPFFAFKNPPQSKPRRAASSADDGIKFKSVISGDMSLRNDTAHDGWGDYFSRNRVLSVMQPSVKKDPRGIFDKLKSRRRPAGAGGSF